MACALAFRHDHTGQFVLLKSLQVLLVFFASVPCRLRKEVSNEIMASAQTLVNTYARAPLLYRNTELGSSNQIPSSVTEVSHVTCVKHTGSHSIALVHSIPLPHCKNPVVAQMHRKNAVGAG